MTEAKIVSGKAFFAEQRKIDTPSGSINYVEQGSGPVALFVHGYFSMDTCGGISLRGSKA